MTDISTDPALDEWRTYDEFAAGIDTFRLPNTKLAGTALTLTLDDDTALALRFDEESVAWEGLGSAGRDPYAASATTSSS